ncbi:related to alpha-amylase [Armillaria ostoyae]|uniref:Related to alpha-amylase n=1 Tax=Armillaria ostoyae TaxID=47428 RepID=A0A284RSB5_ARMOS|nr:related to alpha-amylase [Armillaria ostoyae]
MTNDNEQNHTMIQAFEWYSEGNGVHWKKIADVSPELGEMGITAMWLPPPTKAAGQESVGYDIYDLYDLGEFDQKGGVRTKYGTKEEFLRAIKKAKQHGIVTYIDAVLNHKFGAERTEEFGATEVANSDRNKEVSDVYDIKGWTGFDFPGRGGKYSKFKWNFNHFTGVDYDDKNGKSTIFRIHGDGKNWAQGVDDENSNYDYLMGADIDHSHPDARKDVINWGKWVIKETGAVGFRFDAVKHIDSQFIAEFVKAVREDANDPHLFAVGEYWKDDLSDLEDYLSALGTQYSVFDTPLHYNFKEAGDRAEEYDMRAIWDSTIVQERPIDAVTLVDNHDTVSAIAITCLMLLLSDPCSIASRPGVRELGFSGIQALGIRFDPAATIRVPMRLLGRLLYAYGELRDYWDHMNCVGWVRMGEKDKGIDGCAVVLCNGSGEGSKRMEVGKEHAGEKWKDLLGWYQGDVVIEDDGWAEFKCSARSVSIWVKEGAKGR